MTDQQLTQSDFIFADCMALAVRLINVPGGVNAPELVQRLMSTGYQEDIAIEVLDFLLNI